MDSFWIVLGLGALLALGAGLAVFYGQRLASSRADALRRLGDHRTANATDQVRMDKVNPAALPMHDRAFDKPS